nr:hypothetical protein [Acidithiobacillus sp. AMEEHan]
MVKNAGARLCRRRTTAGDGKAQGFLRTLPCAKAATSPATIESPAPTVGADLDAWRIGEEALLGADEQGALATRETQT